MRTALARAEYDSASIGSVEPPAGNGEEAKDKTGAADDVSSARLA